MPPTDEFDLGQQRSRHLNEIDPTANDRRGKAGEVADHASTQRDDEIVALDFRCYQRLGDLLQAVVALAAFTPADDDLRAGNAGGLERSFGLPQPVRGHGAIGNNRGACARTQRRDPLAERLQRACADDDVVGALGQCDLDDRFAIQSLRLR